MKMSVLGHRSFVTFTFFLLVAGQLAVSPSYAAEDYVKYSSELQKKTNWDEMITVTVGLKEFGYVPEKIIFKAGRPYKLELINIGKEKHYFTAPEFYKSIATRKVQANKLGEVKAPYFLAIELLSGGGQLDLYFVPMKKGTYKVFCTRKGHRKKGMEGILVIE